MKQYNFICENGHDNFYYENQEQPFKCSTCSLAFEEERVKEVENNDLREIIGLTLVYQKTNEKIEIEVQDKVLLGRNYVGKEIFSKILIWNGREMVPVISKIHCSISFVDGCFQVLDEGSTNGTFYSINKHSCKGSPMVIENKSILFIGEEAFLVQINYRELKQEVNSCKIIENTNETITIKQYRCRICGKKFDEFSDACPDCNTYNSLIPDYSGAN